MKKKKNFIYMRNTYSTIAWFFFCKLSRCILYCLTHDENEAKIDAAEIVGRRGRSFLFYTVSALCIVYF